MQRTTNKQPKLKIRKGDTVKIISGNYRSTPDKVNQGKVLEVLLERNRVIVEGINMVTKHQKPSAGNPKVGSKRPKHRFISATLCCWIRQQVSLRKLVASSMTKASFNAS